MANEEKFMLMVHPSFPDREPAKVLKSQFEKRWKEKGWVEAKKEDSSTTTKKEDSSTTTTTSTTATTPTGGNKDK